MFRHEYFSAFCRIIGHPVRLAIVDAIAEHNNCIEESTLVIPQVSPYSIARHMKALKRSGIIKGTMSKSKQCYCIDWDKLESFKLVFDDMFDRVSSYREEVIKNEGSCIKK